MVGLICTPALVSRQDICQEQLGGGWRRGGSCSGSPTASGSSWACSGARSLSHFTALWGFQTWHCYEPWGHPLPCCSPFFRSVHCFPQRSSLHLTLFLCLISPRTPPSLLGAPLLSRMGQQTRHRALLCRHSHLTECGTTWLITNPILGSLCASRVGSVFLSHFIRAITGHFLFVCRLMLSVTH